MPALPKYGAVMECGPFVVLRYVITQVSVSAAVPLAGWAAHPEIAEPPSKNSTLPVRLPVPEPVAVTVTG
jgi:hypothetical protein